MLRLEPRALGRREPLATILVTSIGSGVGRSILDALSGRRAGVRLIGGDANAQAVGMGECDEAVVLPTTDHPGFLAAVESVCESRGVDLVLPGRDPDAVGLSEAAWTRGAKVRAPCAPPALVAMARDKWASYRWCTERDIPFADSVATDEPDAERLAMALVERHGFPLVCKPRAGSASLGVTIVVDQRHLQGALAQSGMLLQPFLSPPQPALRLDTSAGLPLFWEVPCPDEPAIMALLGPEGELGPHLCFTGSHRFGRTENLRRLDDESLSGFAGRVVARFGEEGWRGPLNLQVRRGHDGWRIIEINPRFTGGTAGRLHLGLDEVGWVVNRWLGEDVIPAWPHAPAARVDRVPRDVPVAR